MGKNRGPTRFELVEKEDVGFLERQRQRAKNEDDTLLARIGRAIEARRQAQEAAKLESQRRGGVDEPDTKILERARRDVEAARRAGKGPENG